MINFVKKYFYFYLFSFEHKKRKKINTKLDCASFNYNIVMYFMNVALIFFYFFVQCKKVYALKLGFFQNLNLEKPGKQLDTEKIL